jgi:hypothetical protein
MLNPVKADTFVADANRTFDEIEAIEAGAHKSATGGFNEATK